MLLKVRQVGDSVLRAKAQPLSLDQIRSEDTQRLIKSMRETLLDAPGIGLAAPQVGESLQLAVIEIGQKNLANYSVEEQFEKAMHEVPFHVIVNPRIVNRSSDNVMFHEGCLSLSGFKAAVLRNLEVSVEALNELGRPVRIDAAGWYARALQHEIDHLTGDLYIDKMEPRSFTDSSNYKRHFKGS